MRRYVFKNLLIPIFTVEGYRPKLAVPCLGRGKSKKRRGSQPRRSIAAQPRLLQRGGVRRVRLVEESAQLREVVLGKPVHTVTNRLHVVQLLFQIFCNV